MDELVPVSCGGSPYDPANCVGAHACCNNWRKAKPVGQVRAVQSMVATTFGGSSDPVDFVAKAKAVTRGGAMPPSPVPVTTTDW